MLCSKDISYYINAENSYAVYLYKPWYFFGGNNVKAFTVTFDQFKVSLNEQKHNNTIFYITDPKLLKGIV